MRSEREMMHRPRLIVLTAPSGSGKTTIATRVMGARPDLRFSVSATTRACRPDEEDGVDYHFLSPERFQALIESGDMLEFEEVYPGRLYGTMQSEIDRAAREGPVLLDVDVRGAFNIRRMYGEDAFIVFVNPPSEAELERRLRERATEDESTIRVRLDRAHHELKFAERADAVVENDDLEKAVSETLHVIRRFLAPVS